MYRSLVATVALVAAPVAWAAPATTPANTVESLPIGVLLDTTTTSAGQNLTLPQRPELHVAVFTDPPGWSSEWHVHHYPRYVYVLEGTLTVEDEAGHRTDIPAGHFSVEMLEHRHHGLNTGPGPVKFLVIDQVPPGYGPNMIKQQPPAQHSSNP